MGCTRLGDAGCGAMQAIVVSQPFVRAVVWTVDARFISAKVLACLKVLGCFAIQIVGFVLG